MLWIDTMPYITAMKNKKPGRDWAFQQLIGKAMSPYVLIRLESAVPIFADISGPKPAVYRGLVHEAPEALFRCDLEMSSWHGQPPFVDRDSVSMVCGNQDGDLAFGSDPSHRTKCSI